MYKNLIILLVIITFASCRDNSNTPEPYKLLVVEGIADKEKILLDELAKLYPHGEDKFAEVRKNIESNRLKFKEQHLLSNKKEALFHLRQIIKKLEEEIKTYKNLLQDGEGSWQYQPREEVEKGLKYDEKLLELYKFREEYYEHDLKVAESSV